MLLTLVISISLVGTAFAHKQQVIGDYLVEVGWGKEQAMVGQDNKIVVNVTVASTEQKQSAKDMNMTSMSEKDMANMTVNEPAAPEEEMLENGVSGLSDKLDVDVAINGKKTFLKLEEDSGNPGHYTADFTPKESGFPLVHVFGNIKGTDLEVTFHLEKVEVEGEQMETSTVSKMSSDGSIKVVIESSIPKTGDPMSIDLKFTDMSGNLIKNINHDITARQDSNEVLSETGVYHSTGEGTHMTKPLTSGDPVDIQVKILGIGMPGSSSTWIGPKGDVVSFQVVPEFGPLSMLILAISVTSIVVLGLKTRFFQKI